MFLFKVMPYRWPDSFLLQQNSSNNSFSRTGTNVDVMSNPPVL